jgi:hypothetical protein
MLIDECADMQSLTGTKPYYSHFLAHAQDRIRSIASEVARAPSQSHYAETLQLVDQVFDDLHELMRVRHAASEQREPASQGLYDGIIPGAGSSKRALFSFERGKQSKRRKAQETPHQQARRRFDPGSKQSIEELQNICSSLGESRLANSSSRDELEGNLNTRFNAAPTGRQDGPPELFPTGRL